MSQHFFSTNGYGFSFNALTVVNGYHWTDAGFKSLIKKAPKLFAKAQGYLDGIGVSFETAEESDFENYENDNGYTGVEMMFCEAISEIEDIEFSYQNAEDATYCMVLPIYPWNEVSEKEKNLTQEQLDSIYANYTEMVYGKPVTGDYVTAEYYC